MYNYNKKTLREEIDNLKKLRGKERGADIKYLVNYVKEKEGENRLDLLIAELKEFGFELPDLSSVKNTEWLEESIPNIFLVGAARFFNWSNEDIYNLGKNIMSFSATTKMFIKFFSSPEKTSKKIVHNWNQYYTQGKLSLAYFDNNKKELLLELKNFRTHPFFGIFFSGVIAGLMEVITGSEKVKAEEIECVFRGDKSHKFKLTW